MKEYENSKQLEYKINSSDLYSSMRLLENNLNSWGCKCLSSVKKNSSMDFDYYSALYSIDEVSIAQFGSINGENANLHIVLGSKQNKNIDTIVDKIQNLCMFM